MYVKTDIHGNSYFEDANGVRQLIPKSALENKEIIFMNDKGETYTKDKEGNI